jgi:hypothetical protein
MNQSKAPPLADLLGDELKIINVGIELFADELESVGAVVVRVDWRPPAGGDPRLAALLGELSG